MSTADIRAGGAYVELYGKNAALKQTLQASTQDVQKWAQQISGLGIGLSAIGTAVLAPLAAAGKAFADQGGMLDDLSQRTGASAEALSGLQYAAELTGTGIEDLAGGFRKLAQTVDSALTGNQAAVDLFSSLGLTLDDLKGKKPEEIFSLLADRIAAIDDPIRRSALAMDLFGKSGDRLLPMLVNGSAGLESLKREARDLGLVMSGEDIAAAAEFGDSLDRAWAACRGFAVTVGGALAPALQAGADLFVALSKGTREFIKENPGLVTALALGGAAILGVGVALAGLSMTITFVGTAIAGLTGLFGIAAAAAASPVVWAVAAGAALTGLVGYATGAFDALGALFNELSAGASSMVGGIANAIRAGDLTTAWQIVTSGLYIAWIRTVNYIKQLWRDATEYLGAALAGPLLVVTEGFSTVTTVFQGVYDTVAGLLGGIVTLITTGDITAAWEQVGGAIQASWSNVMDGLTDSIANVAMYVGKALYDPLKATFGELISFMSELKDMTGIDLGLESVKAASQGLDVLKNAPQSPAEIEAANKAKADKAAAEKADAEALQGARDAYGKLLDKVKPPEIEKSLKPIPEAADGALRSGGAAGLESLSERTSGTFSARAAAGFSGNATSRIAKAVEETAKNTKAIAEKPGLVYTA